MALLNELQGFDGDVEFQPCFQSGCTGSGGSCYFERHDLRSTQIETVPKQCIKFVSRHGFPALEGNTCKPSPTLHTERLAGWCAK